LYERFIKGYTHKQWETDPKKLPANIISRLPVRYNYGPDYFDDPRQGIPVEGYHNIFRNMLNNPNISVYLNTDYFSIRHKVPKDCHIVYTGPVDRFFDYKYGKLKWRTLKFEKEIINVEDYQGTSVMNYADVSVPHTRIHEFKHYHKERNYPIDSTVIFREYSAASTIADEPYYPINTDEDRSLFQIYATECKKCENILFGGRLGTYRYLDMDQSIAEALEMYEQLIHKN